MDNESRQADSAAKSGPRINIQEVSATKSDAAFEIKGAAAEALDHLAADSAANQLEEVEMHSSGDELSSSGIGTICSSELASSDSSEDEEVK